ncbi:hypothetical protein OE749_10085 [Aestuariibacter sp. AA17]|uniref:Leukocidin/Hemolysin toxin domain-containing protein n=1 Tax=Fluctibacter corallii TaxID=2984329 RepID=A0ABT3A8M3_9ALTE|nr:hypothetical protein [Aestuariibacter sp. AA17]MCV2885040.1 hypothetical protein [Aestuariibacter sp. AA17]
MKHVNLIFNALLVATSMSQVQASPLKLNESQQSLSTTSQSLSILSLSPNKGSFVLGHLSDQSTITPAIYSEDSPQQQASKLVSQHDSIYINASYTKGLDTNIDQYLSEAYKQGKPIIIENANFAFESSFASLPSLSQGDIVLIHPSRTSHPDQVFTYSAVSATYNEGLSSSSDSQNTSKDNLVEISTSNLTESYKTYALEETLSSMAHDKRQTMLSQFEQDLLSPTHDIISNTETRKANTDTLISANSAGGFTFSYPCPANLKDERECYTAVSINHLFNYDNGEKVFNGTRHYAYAMYKSDGIKYVAFSLHGSANPTMTKDSSTEKAWYLEYVDLDMDVKEPDATYANAAIISRLPGNESDTVALTSTSGLSVSTGLDSEGKVTAGVSFDQSNSVRKDIRDWQSSTRSRNGRDIGWLYELKYPRSDKEWVNFPAFKKATYKSTPAISKYGLQYVSEGVWTIPASDTRRFHVDTKTKWQVKKRKFTKRTIFKYEQTAWWSWWSKSRYTWLNLGWLQ